MRNFRKRTIALCLASAITVLGSFASETYNNSIISLRINSGSYGKVSITAYTKKPYERTAKTEKVDENTYNIYLPGARSELTAMPPINRYDNIDSIQVSTYPYSIDIEGYTLIQLKTKGSPSVSAETALFIPDKSMTTEKEPAALSSDSQKTSNVPATSESNSYWQHHVSSSQPESKPSPQKKQSTQPKTSYKEKNTSDNYSQPDIPMDVPISNTNEKMPIIIGAILLIFLVTFIIFLNKDKMASIVGNQNDFDFDENDNQEKKKNKKVQKYRNTINKLDKTYKNTGFSGDINMVTGQAVQKSSEPEQSFNTEKVEQETAILDLDSLYSEKNKDGQSGIVESNENNENEVDDLADFLNEFSFAEEPQENENTINEELYQNTINNNTLNFSKNDSSRISQLLQNEIGEDTLNNIEEFAPQTHEPPKPPSEIEILENVIAEYTIKQNLSFSKDDVDTIRKLINVELDETFIKDLRTNPKRTEEMQKEIENKEKRPHKTSEMIILNVKDLLPDLSKELKKQGNKKIESNAKPEVIYYSEGYEVSKLSVSSDLANVSKAVHENKEATQYRPSDDLPIVEKGYDVQTLSIKDKLPDISEYKVNPLKYENKKPAAKADEKALLNSIANVQFKPFYEEVHEELNQFEGFEIIDNEAEEKKAEEQALKELEEYSKVQLKRKKPQQTPKIKDDAKKLMELIEEKQAEREIKKQASNNIQQQVSVIEKPQEKNNTPDVCKIDGVSYNIIKSVSCENNLSCYLAKDDKGYEVIGNLNGNYKILKHYDQLRTENLQARISETNPDGSIQYLIRTSVHKFIIKIMKNEMEFIMDLC